MSAETLDDLAALQARVTPPAEEQSVEQAMADVFAAFVQRPCAACTSPLMVMPGNARPICDACLARDAEKDRRIVARRAFEATLPEAYRWALLESPLLPKRVTPAAALADGRDAMSAPWVIFQGESGMGKTSLAVALVRERMRITGDTWVMLLAFRLGNARIQHRAGDGEPAIIDQAVRSPCVLLDDLGQETMTANNPIADIIQERDAERRTTWITTGLSISEFGNRYGGGVARRVFERSRVIRLGRKAAP